MTIIFANSLDEDSLTLQRLWNGLEDATIIEVTPRSVSESTQDIEELVDAAIEAEDDTLILAGHGTTHGLLYPATFVGNYLVHENNVSLIHAKRVICIWCYASTFCQNHNLHSFSTSMFISNIDEAYANGIDGYSQDEINEIGKRFHADVNQLLTSNTPLDQWQMILGAKMDVENEIDKFNRQGIFFI